MAIPVLAVLELDASTAQVAWLTFLGQLPPALLALHAGALGDRHSKWRQMITAIWSVPRRWQPSLRRPPWTR
ncbi:hypothetical protein [Streptomyces sp. NPDC001530]|uniref:hypothetical protein n=1 Tax=Streptomyces sp. NPDC001530 TaxID=3364582 RepID=UPI0036962BC6